jgi:hypothetical protein
MKKRDRFPVHHHLTPTGRLPPGPDDDQLDAVSAADRAYFAAHPEIDYYTRLPFPVEKERDAACTSIAVFDAPGCGGLRLRVFLHGAETADDALYHTVMTRDGPRVVGEFLSDLRRRARGESLPGADAVLSDRCTQCGVPFVTGDVTMGLADGGNVCLRHPPASGIKCLGLSVYQEERHFVDCPPEVKARFDAACRVVEALVTEMNVAPTPPIWRRTRG